MAPTLRLPMSKHHIIQEQSVARALRNGFTIIELLMVLAIIAIISAVALPKLDFRGYRVDAATRGLAAALGAAQRQAVTNQSNVNVLFDSTNNAIKVHQDDNNDNIQTAGENVRQYPIGEGVNYGLGGAPARQFAGGAITFTRRQGALPELIFRRDGSASESGAVYLTSQNAVAGGRLKDARSIEVIEATGRVAWYRYTGAAWTRKF